MNELSGRSSSPAGSSYSGKSSHSKKSLKIIDVGAPSTSSSSSRDTKKSETEGSIAGVKPISKRKSNASNSSKSATKARTKQTKVKVSYSSNTTSTVHVGQVTEDEYIVEKIVGKRFTHTEEGVIPQYLIKWKGWASAHNTWEPVENLDGCPDLLEKYETNLKEKRKAKKARLSKTGTGKASDSASNSGQSSCESESDMQKTKQELIEYGINQKWPTSRIPLNLLGVVTINDHLCYLVRCMTTGNEVCEELTQDNVLIVRAADFKEKFFGIVIEFYEKQILWTMKNTEVMVVKEQAEKLIQKAEQQVQEDQIKSNKTESVISAPNNGGGESDSSTMEVDQEEEEEEQKIFIKKPKDLFGLPEGMESSESSSDDDYQEIFIPVKK